MWKKIWRQPNLSGKVLWVLRDAQHGYRHGKEVRGPRKCHVFGTLVPDPCDNLHIKTYLTKSDKYKKETRKLTMESRSSPKKDFR